MSGTGSTGNMLNTGALSRAGGIGLAVGLVFQLISVVVSLSSFAPTSVAGSYTSETLVTTLGGVLVGLCCLIALLYAAIGAGYSWFVEKSGGPLEIGPAALGGAVAAFADGILLGICSVGLNYLTGVLNMAVQSGDPAFGTAVGGISGLVGAGFGMIVNVCILPLVYAALGAAGAAVYAAARSNRSKPQPAAM